MHLASKPRNLQLPKLAAGSKKVQNTALYYVQFCLYLQTVQQCNSTDLNTLRQEYCTAEYKH